MMAARTAARKIMMPTGGLDRVSPVSQMPPDRATILTNMFPDLGHISVRPGYVAHALGMTGPVESLIPWRGAAGVSKLFAAANGGIYDVTDAANVGAPVVSGLLGNRWQHTHMASSGGQFVVACNGVDAERTYNGTAWEAPTITGHTAGSGIHVVTHKRRLFLTIKASTTAEYLAVDSVAGAVSSFDLGPLFRAGGYLMAIGTWTLDTGVGPDDYAVFISSEGEAVVFQGTDPSTAGEWSIVGVYQVGRPIGRRCTVDFGGDLWVITHAGVMSMNGIIRAGEAVRAVDDATMITQHVRDAWSVDATAYALNWGWEAMVYPEGRCALFNVPQSEHSLQHQYVLNTLTKAFARYDDLNANCWCRLGDTLYFGGNDGIVYRALGPGLRDDAGNAINWEMATAFTDYGDPMFKHTKRVLLTLESDGVVRPAIGIDADYANVDPTQEFSYDPPGNPFILNQSVLNGGDVLGGREKPGTKWIGIGRTGHVLSLHLRGQSAGLIARITAASLLYEQGGPL